MPTTDEIRHACFGCGGSCQGATVSLIDESEVERVRAAAARMLRPDPVVGGQRPRLRLDGGLCALLDERSRCTIYEDRPEICRQYPLVAVRAEGELRFGVDPGCYTAIHTWRTGPTLQGLEALVLRSDLAGPDLAFERSFLALCQAEACTLRDLVSGLSGGDVTGFCERLAVRLRAAELATLLSQTAPAVRLALAKVAAHSAVLAGSPGWPHLDDETDSYAVDAVRRMVYLRLSGAIPSLYGVGLLAVMGALACGWAEPDKAAYGRSLAAWMRVMRAPAFFSALLPDPAAVKWLATGS